jgi:hypothetical protein
MQQVTNCLLLVFLLFVPICSKAGDIIVTTSLKVQQPQEDDPWSGIATNDSPRGSVVLKSAPANLESVWTSDLREIQFLVLDGSSIPKITLESRITVVQDWNMALGELDAPLQAGLYDLEKREQIKPDLVVYSGEDKDLVLSPTGFLVYPIGSRHFAIEFLMGNDGAMFMRCRQVFANLKIEYEGGRNFFFIRPLGKRVFTESLEKLAGEEYVLLHGKLANMLWALYVETSSQRFQLRAVK